MGPEKFQFPIIKRNSKPEVGSTNESIRHIPVVEAEDVSRVGSENKDADSLPSLRTPESSSVNPPEILLEGEKTPDQLIGEARNKYINSFSAWQKFKQDKPSKELSSMEQANRDAEEESLSMSSADSYKKYQETIKEIVKNELDKEREESMRAWTVEESTERIAIKQAELVEKYVIKEASYLEDQKAESWPPKEKGWWGTTLESYSKLPKSLKFAASAAVGTAVAVSMPGIAVGGMVGLGGIAGLRLARGIGGSFVGAGINKLVGNILGVKLEKEVKQYEEKISSLETSSKVSFEDIQKQHEEFLLKRDKLKTRNKWLSIAAGVVSGAGLSAVSGMLENSAATGLGLKNTLPKEEHFVDGRVINSEPKSYFPGHSPEEQIKPDLGDTHPIPDAELNYEPTPKVEVQPEAIVGNPTPKPEGILPNSEAAVGSPVEVGSEDLTSQIERLTVQPKEGFWQPISREMEFRIKANPEKYGLTPDDVLDENSPALAKAVVRETNQVLKNNELMDSSGEIRISQPGSILRLSEDGKLEVSDDTKLYSHNFSDSPVEGNPTEQLVGSPAPKELGEESIKVEQRNLSAFRNSRNVEAVESIPTQPAELLTSNELVGESTQSVERIIPAVEVSEMSESWRTEALIAHEKLEPLVHRAEELSSQMNEEFFLNLKKAPLSELNKYENILTGGNSEILEIENLTKALEEDGLEAPESYLEISDDLKEKLETLAKIKAERTAEFSKFEQILPPDYISNSNITLKQYLEVESVKYDIPGQPSSRALEDFINSANPSPSDMNLKLREFIESRFDNQGFRTAPSEYEASEITLRPSLNEISSAMKAHAQINATRIEMPDYMENLNLSLEASKSMSLEEFNKNFINNSEFGAITKDLTAICKNASENIKSLEDAGWKVDPELKNSVRIAVEKMQELDSLSDKYSEAWKEFLSDVGLDEQSYTNAILNVKDNAGHPLVIDTGTVLDMPKYFTPSQLDKFVGLVDRVKELTEDLTPEELAEVRKLPVDQLIKQNIKL
jgi:hypothetical protein